MTREEREQALEWFKSRPVTMSGAKKMYDLAIEALSQPEVVRCGECAFWDRDTLRHQFNDFRDWNEAECKVLAERDGYNEINRYVEADDFCSRAERRTE